MNLDNKHRHNSKLAMRGGFPRTVRKIGVHGMDCGGLCDKGESDFLPCQPAGWVRGDFFWSSFVWQTKEDKIQSKAQHRRASWY